MNPKGVKMPPTHGRGRPFDRLLEVIAEEDLDMLNLVPAIQANQNISTLSFIVIFILIIIVRQLFF